MLVQVYDEKQALPLGEMEKSWMQLPTSVASYAYAWALANIEYIVQTDGMGDVERILNLIAAGEFDGGGDPGSAALELRRVGKRDGWLFAEDVYVVRVDDAAGVGLRAWIAAVVKIVAGFNLNPHPLKAEGAAPNFRS